MVAQQAMASTREAYGKALLELADSHPGIVVLGGDLNVSVFTHLWRDKYPDRFFDFGPAEQNLIGVGAGLAASGKIPFVSTFAVFGMGRPFDQLRVLVAQSHLNLKLVCTHAGVMTGDIAKKFSDQFRSNGSLLVSATVEKRYKQKGCARLSVNYTKKQVQSTHGMTDALLKTQINYCLDGRAPDSLEEAQ